ncbi:hypothetical protein BELL_0398g00130 [Botrytis elliptica]|uniref:Uncharacterized protein n=1 Tax=Botrytis elliptica TaxID=278938 RepID=A0A4Z1JI86_9HELO|nr:hypothetical protein EAE99_003181 [Botrytis elliptica]TGO73024.1 hypothetical protein BELL_0398g00130 [Botrytis elliptica]
MAAVGDHESTIFEAAAAMCDLNPTASSAALDESKNVTSEGLDSGYASQATTPDTPCLSVDCTAAGGKTLSPCKPKKLQAYNKPIPPLTWERFSDLREQYAESLNNFTRSLPSFSSILMTLQVLGEDEESAEPWVFVQCDKAVFKKVNNFFKKPLIKVDFEPSQPDNRSPRLRVLVCPLKPRYLAKDSGFSSEHDSHINEEAILIFSKSPIRDTLCGTQITTESSCQATIGGIIKVTHIDGQERFFGMSAGHFILEDCQDEASQDFDDESYEADFQFDLSSVNADIEKEHQSVQSTSNELMGRISLADVSNPSLNGGKNLDWSLVSIIDRGIAVLPNICMEKCIFEIRPHGLEPPQIDVRVLLAGEQIRGKMSTLTSYLMVPPGNALVQTYLLSCTDGTVLQPGTSGAWVIDANSNRLYGHVVASDVFNRVYVVPIHDSLENIRSHLSAVSVTLCDVELAEPGDCTSSVDSGYSTMKNSPGDLYSHPPYLMYSTMDDSPEDPLEHAPCLMYSTMHDSPEDPLEQDPLYFLEYAPRKKRRLDKD